MEMEIQPGDSLTVAVTEAISDLEDRPPDTLPPLHTVIQNDLDEIFNFENDTPETGHTLRLTFEYMDYYVTIDNDATLSVERKPERPFTYSNSR